MLILRTGHVALSNLGPGPATHLQKGGRMIVLQNQTPLSTDFFIARMTPYFQNR